MPYAPTINNLDLFGAAASILDRPVPPEVQATAFCGLNGVDLIQMGSRGYILDCSGLLWSDTIQGLMLVIQTWQNFRDASAVPGFAGYTVVDNFDRTWLNCLVRSFDPASKVIFDTNGPVFSGSYEYSQPYRMQLYAPRKPILP